MKKRQLMTLASGATIAVLALSGCGSDSTPASPTESQPSTATPSEDSVNQEALLATNDELSASLGDAYVQGWIEDGELHVATTDGSKVAEIEAAGAVAKVVDFSAAQLREGINEIMRWQAGQDAEIRNSIHGYSISAKDGGLSLRVDPNHIEEVQSLLEKDKPAGDIPLSFTPSSGIASRAAGE